METLTNEQLEKVEELDSVIEGIQNIKEKLDLHRNVELVMYALEKNLCT